MSIAIGDGASPQRSSEIQARQVTGGGRRSLIRLRVGSVHLGIPVGLVPTPVLSLLLGAAVSSYTVMSFSESGVVQAMMTFFQPIKTSLDVRDAATGADVWPENKSYVVRPGQVLRIRLQPGTPPFWVTLVTEGFGSLEPPNGLASEVYYTAPSLPEGDTVRAGSIAICTGDRAEPEKATCSVPIVITTRADSR